MTFSSLLSHANHKHPLWKENLESSRRLILCDGSFQCSGSNHENNEPDSDGSSHNDAADPNSSSDAANNNLTDVNGAGGSSNTSSRLVQ